METELRSTLSKKMPALYVQSDYSKHYLAVDPLFKDPHFPSNVMQLGVSLDLAKIFAKALKAGGHLKHAEIVEDWIERISKRPVSFQMSETLPSTVTEWVCNKSPSETYYKIISEHTNEVIGKCTGTGMSDVLEENSGSTFKEITKEEFEKEDL